MNDVEITNTDILDLMSICCELLEVWRTHGRPYHGLALLLAKDIKIAEEALITNDPEDLRDAAETMRAWIKDAEVPV